MLHIAHGATCTCRGQFSVLHSESRVARAAQCPLPCLLLMTDSAVDNYRHRLQCTGVWVGVCTVVQAGTTGRTRSLRTGEVRAGRGQWPVVSSASVMLPPGARRTQSAVAWARQPRPSVQRRARASSQHNTLSFYRLCRRGGSWAPCCVSHGDHVLS